MRSLFLLSLVLCVISGNVMSAVERVLPDGFAANVRDYGALGDGVTDDTAAIRAALDDGRNGNNPAPDYYAPRPRTVYFPKGVYLVSDTITWTGIAMHLQGQGPTATVFRLKDSATGFGDAANRKPVFTMQGGNYSFRMNFWDLAIDTGSGNPGAVGIDYICNNWGSLRDVWIRSGDGQGVAGIDMTRQWPGPCLLKNLHIHGFQVGIDIAHAEYGPTFENVIFTGQTVAGIRNAGNVIAMHNLTSAISVPTITSDGSSANLILSSITALKGDVSRSAIEVAAGMLYVRNVQAQGYRSAVSQGSTVVTGMMLPEYVKAPVQQRFTDSHAGGLLLPIA